MDSQDEEIEGRQSKGNIRSGEIIIKDDKGNEISRYEPNIRFLG